VCKKNLPPLHPCMCLFIKKQQKVLFEFGF
jgi:hypothetical protein